MRKIFAPIAVVFALFAGLVSGQQIRVVDGVTIVRDGRSAGRYGASAQHQPSVQMAICNEDTVAYALNKSTNLRVVNMNGSNSAAAFGQYYDAPQPIAVNKLRFFAYKLSAIGGTSANVVVEIYNARPDSLPLGAPLRTATVSVDTSFHQGSLEGLQKVAVFSSPALITSGGYVVVVRNTSANPIGVVINDYMSTNGAGEWLATAQYAGIWRHPYQLNVSGNPFDCDILLDPVVSYTLRANFTTNPGCVSAAGNVSFTNASSPILAHRMYNYAAFLQRPGLSVLWNFDDGSGTIRQHLTMDTVHHYAAAGSYNVTLRDTLYGWSKRTVADTMISLGNAPEAIFFQSMTGLVGHFTDHSQGGATSWYWSFGDGTTSTQQNPYHTFATAGVYQVCLWSSNMCGVDSTCHTVVLACPLPTAAFSSNASNLDVAFTDWSTGGVTSWEWSFGDSATSTAQNPVHSYAAAGNYLVHLRTYNACGMDSSWYWLNVTCPASVAAFAATVQQFTATFHDQSTGLVTDWLWDFGDGSNSNATHPIHTYSMPGTYTVCLNTIGECGNSLICHDVEVGVTAMDLGLSNQFAIHPNPASSELHVVTQLPTADHVQLVVTDLLGALVQRVDLGLVQSSAIDLDVHHLAAGSYLISFQTSNGTVVKRFQVVR